MRGFPIWLKCSCHESVACCRDTGVWLSQFRFSHVCIQAPALGRGPGWAAAMTAAGGLAQASRSLSPTTPAMIATTQASRAADAASPWTMPAVTTPAAPMPTQTA